ncbi:helix-turn-helix domain-containing protein [Flammeovirga sp. SJP92]|uniref:helix-turn-helix domain-containing protein n=1 Tax=Flammeovirga sp. SJP92 TaxID=1775430 RepID=UPI000789996A|nr:helix-turn-helix domain-containing protein [Flammeovirga sp. SJP92]KXX70482.1 hypothetical protein AVL50_08985 [Flammeovirga sp. SJP92]
MKNLNIADRKYIEFALFMKRSKRHIAKKLGVSPSTIYREIKRNSKGKQYEAQYAQQLALARKKLAGGSQKKLKLTKRYKRKNPYRLYADRRQIFWCSDARLVYSHYLRNTSLRLTLKKKRYRKRLHQKKTFHFRNDLPLFLLLKEHKEKYIYSKQPFSTKSIEIILNSIKKIA